MPKWDVIRMLRVNETVLWWASCLRTHPTTLEKRDFWTYLRIEHRFDCRFWLLLPLSKPLSFLLSRTKRSDYIPQPLPFFWAVHPRRCYWGSLSRSHYYCWDSPHSRHPDSSSSRAWISIMISAHIPTWTHRHTLFFGGRVFIVTFTDGFFCFNARSQRNW